MKAKTLHRTIPTLLLTAAAAVPAGSALAATAHASTTTSQVFKGPFEDMRWGPVRASITVKNKKITKVGITVTPETSRSQFIDDQAVPMLKTEVLQAQSATIDGVSGATNTSDAFTQSLQAAIAKAKTHKALK
ncbi:MAG TPA: FMN-binding protein, partial [Chloroflexota bacterium]